MDHIGIDVHKRESQIYILAAGGEVIEQRIRTEPEHGDGGHEGVDRCRSVLMCYALGSRAGGSTRLECFKGVLDARCMGPLSIVPLGLRNGGVP
jgi:hypothetical protein